MRVGNENEIRLEVDSQDVEVLAVQLMDVTGHNQAICHEKELLTDIGTDVVKSKSESKVKGLTGNGQRLFEICVVNVGNKRTTDVVGCNDIVNMLMHGPIANGEKLIAFICLFVCSFIYLFMQFGCIAILL